MSQSVSPFPHFSHSSQYLRLSRPVPTFPQSTTSLPPTDGESSMHALLAAAVMAVTAVQADTSYLYRTHFIRAAPGEILELVDVFQERMNFYDAAGESAPFVMRHAQGDHWDLQIMYPMGSFVDYYSSSRVERRETAAAASGVTEEQFRKLVREHTSWQEELYVLGPPLETMTATMNSGGYFHTEIMIALPGMQDELFHEREMENVYQRLTGRPERMIFTRVSGAPWDNFTLGIFRDLQHFAVPSGMTAEETEAAARDSGFESSAKVGVYMRSLILRHQDTHGGIVTRRR